jgi:hypothetical protein
VHVFVVCYDGKFYDVVPEDVRKQGPWQGQHLGDVDKLKPEYRLALARDGYSYSGRSYGRAILTAPRLVKPPFPTRGLGASPDYALIPPDRGALTLINPARGVVRNGLGMVEVGGAAANEKAQVLNTKTCALPH